MYKEESGDAKSTSTLRAPSLAEMGVDKEQGYDPYNTAKNAQSSSEKWVAPYSS